jgi:CubicO group peptidase (beta-lactamase class C family)
VRQFLAAVAAVYLVTSCAMSPEEAVDRLFRDYAGDATPGAAVRVIRDGEVILTRTYGMANIESGQPVTAATNFRLASISKQFTAMSILMLIEQNRLTLDTVLLQIFQDFPAYGDDITIETLLQHRSGLLDYEPLVPEDATEQVHDADVLEILKQQDAGYFPPGSDYRYSNSGYAVLAMIVEEMSNRSFAGFLQARIFTPVGMKNTVAYEEGISTVSDRAMGYTVTDDGVEFTDQSLYSAVLGDGGIYSSLDDLYLWDQALYRDDLISAESKQQMLTPALENYGFGWRIDNYDGHLRYHHSGSTSGFRNYLQRFPDQELTVIVLTNRAEPDVDRLGEKVADLFLP